MFGRVGILELIILILVIFVFFGTKKIPEAAKALAKGLKEFKKEISSKEENDPKKDSTENQTHPE